MRRFRLDIDKLVQTGERLQESYTSEPPPQFRRPEQLDMREDVRGLVQTGERLQDIPTPEPPLRFEKPKTHDMHGDVRNLIEAADRSETEWRDRLERRQNNAYGRTPKA